MPHSHRSQGCEQGWRGSTANTNCHMRKVNVYCKEQTQLHQHGIYCARLSQLIYMDYTTFSLFVACPDNQKIFL